MAYALQDEEQFQKSWQPQQPQLGAAPAGGTAGTPVAAGAAAPTPTGSRFVSFDRYLGANQEAAARTGEKLGYGVQQKGAEAKQAIGNAEGEFASATTAGMGGTEAAARNPTKTLLPPSGPATVQQSGNTAVITRAAQPLTAQPSYTLQEAKTLANTQYTGPNSLAEFRPELRGQVEGAQRTAAQLGTEQGRRALLTEGMAREAGAYGQGMAGLDEALISGVGDNRDCFAKTAGAFSQLGKWLGDAETQAGKAAEMSRKGTEAQANRFGQLVKDYEAAPPPLAQSLVDSANRDAQTEQRNIDNRAEALANKEPLQVTSTTDELAASKYGDKVLNAWIEAGRPEFSGWIRSQKKK